MIARVPRFKVIRGRVYGHHGDFRFHFDARYFPDEPEQNMVDAGEKIFREILKKQKERIQGYPRIKEVVFDNGVHVRY